MTTYRVPRYVAHDVVEGLVDEDLAVFVMHLPDGPPMVLRAMAGWLWLLAVDGERDLVEEVATATASDPEVIGPEIAAFLEALVRDGLLEPTTRLDVAPAVRRT